jgi:hypothetical protein
MMRCVTRSLVPVLGAALLVSAGCGGEATPPPQPWKGFFHPPPKPGQSITGTKQCECRACEPESCCSAEQTELSGPAPAECTRADGDYVFSEECGIRVETCTPRCYPKVWRVPKQESCEDSRPSVCCG